MKIPFKKSVVGAAMALAATMACQQAKATLVVDLRFATGDPKSQVAAVGTYSINVFATETGVDGNNANEGLTNVYGAIRNSTTGVGAVTGGGITGNVATSDFTITPSTGQTGTTQVGAVTNVADWGTISDGNVNTIKYNTLQGATQGTGTSTLANAAPANVSSTTNSVTFFVGTLTYTISSVNAAAGASDATVVSWANGTKLGAALLSKATVDGAQETDAGYVLSATNSVKFIGSGAAVGTTSLGLGSAATNTLTTPPSFVITANSTGYGSAGTTITPVATGSIGLNNIGNGQVEVLIHASKTLPNLTSANFNGGTAFDLTNVGALDADALNLLSYYPWANILIRYPNTLDANNNFFNFDVSGSSATVDQIVAVPEPASLGLVTLGAVALLSRRRKASK